ncbi:MAG: hypothetical protein KF862_08665 [Chitinophagaceae bacterium]|nr:hypothetical protein [Chitinophagaceae bacterium]
MKAIFLVSIIWGNILFFPGSKKLDLSDMKHSGSVREKIVVLNFEKKCDSQSNFLQEFSLKCQQWNLTSNVIREIISERKKISKFDFSYLYEVLPCSYTGQVLINEKKFGFEINAGAYLILNQGRNYFYYDCSGKRAKKYFIVLPATPDTLEENKE